MSASQSVQPRNYTRADVTAIAPARDLAASPRARLTSRGRSTSTGRRPRRSPAREVKDADTIERMRVAGRLAAQARDAGRLRTSRPGVTTDELDRIGHEFLCDHGAYPSTLGYKGFPKSLCSSVNEVICHGIPDARRRRGRRHRQHRHHRLPRRRARRHQRHLPAPATSTRRSRLLVERTREALDRAIKAVQPGPADQRDRPGHRVLRQAVRLRRRPRVHRPRHRHVVPQRPDHPALRRPALRRP